MSKQWQQLSSKIVYQNDYVTVREDQIIAPDGREGIYGYMDVTPAVFVVAINDKNEVCLVEQARYTSANMSWEIVAGNTDGGEALAAAKRELAEEAGIAAATWERLPGLTYPFGSLAREENYIFIATGISPLSEPVTGADDVITGMKWVSWVDIKHQIKTGAITNGQSITTLAKAGLHLGELS